MVMSRDEFIFGPGPVSLRNSKLLLSIDFLDLRQVAAAREKKVSTVNDDMPYAVECRIKGPARLDAHLPADTMRNGRVQ